MSNFMTHNLARLATFRGRDRRAQFWPYVGIVYVARMAVDYVVMSVQMQPFMAKVQALALAHPEMSNETQNPGQYSDSMRAESLEMLKSFGEMFGTMAIVGWITMAVLVALYAAAVARRLHDRAMSGWWGLMPIPFMAFGLGMMPRLVESFGASNPDLGLLGLMVLNGLVSTAALVVLIVLLAKRSDPNVNRYGPPPAVQA